MTKKSKVKSVPLKKPISVKQFEDQDKTLKGLGKLLRKELRFQELDSGFNFITNLRDISWSRHISNKRNVEVIINATIKKG